MKKLISRLIDRYGTDLTIVTERGRVNRKGFLQLVASKSWQNMERMLCTGGEIPRGQYLYIGDADLELKGRDVIMTGGKNYIVRRADFIVYRSEPIFVWGLCVEGGDIWGI